MSESENKSSEVSSSQTFSGFIFGIALGSDLPAAVKDFQAYSNTTNTNTGGQSDETNLASVGCSSVLSAPADGTAGFTAIDDDTTTKINHVSFGANLTSVGTSSMESLTTAATGISVAHGSTASGKDKTTTIGHLSLGNILTSAETSSMVSSTTAATVFSVGHGSTASCNNTTTKTCELSVGTKLTSAATSSVLSTTTAATGFGVSTEFNRTTTEFSMPAAERNNMRVYIRASRNRQKGTSFGTSAGQTGSSMFGTNTGATSSLFGQTSATGAFGGASASIAAVGTTIPFNPPNGQDTKKKRWVKLNINTKR